MRASSTTDAPCRFVCARCRKPVEFYGVFALVRLRWPLCCDGTLAIHFPHDPPATVEMRRVVIRSNSA